MRLNLNEIKAGKREGFWYSKDEPNLPKPVPNSEPFDEQGEFLSRLAKKEKTASQTQYRGWSTCRLCKKMNGSCEFSSGGWTWPEGYSHYVKVHNVRPSDEFFTFITRK